MSTDTCTARIQFRGTSPADEPFGDTVVFDVWADGFHEGGVGGTGERVLSASDVAATLAARFEHHDLARIFAQLDDVRAALKV